MKLFLSATLIVSCAAVCVPKNRGHEQKIEHIEHPGKCIAFDWDNQGWAYLEDCGHQDVASFVYDVYPKGPGQPNYSHHLHVAKALPNNRCLDISKCLSIDGDFVKAEDCRPHTQGDMDQGWYAVKYPGITDVYRIENCGASLGAGIMFLDDHDVGNDIGYVDIVMDDPDNNEQQWKIWGGGALFN